MQSNWLDHNRHIIFILLLMLVVAGMSLFYLQQPSQEVIDIRAPEATATVTDTPTPEPTATSTPAPVRVYITGAVENPDVYFLPQGSIIKDIIALAGGLTADAVDISQFNQALELQDQQHIHIPRRDEENEPPVIQDGIKKVEEANADEPEQSTSPELVDLNTASLETLDTLPSVGPAIAQRIINYRETQGGFKTIEQITEVSGIGEVTFVKIKHLITVE
ncbi:helix-hairpin-helix domain-containing protein [Anaerolineales bacterium HSG24]|nr:helix-hairpin-helix domain-containing protein [Anaerolineales bacterium HSG24]